jgi:PleD family two-component response regulator
MALEALMNLADKAMYGSKRQGKNTYTLASSLVPAE